MAKQAETRLDVIPLARPFMYELVRQSRESVTLAIPASLDAIVISTIEGTFAVRGTRWEGRHVPYHASAVGKAMLAFMPADVQESMLGELRLERHTRRTIVGRDALVAELRQIRELGFAVCLQEEEDGSNAVAAPILDRTGEVVGAIALWGPASRLTRSHLIAFGSKIARACGELRR
jgi:DNA-binding IclR family transcriptional regulator